MENSIHDNPGFLFKTAQLLLIISLILCLGSITTFIVMNVTLGDSPSITSIYWQRIFISKITNVLIIPGLLLMFISGSFLSWNSYGFFKKRWVTIVQILILMIILNAVFIILPLCESVTNIAVSQMQNGILNAEYFLLKGKEDMFGSFNFIMMLSCIILIIYKSNDMQH